MAKPKDKDPLPEPVAASVPTLLARLRKEAARPDVGEELRSRQTQDLHRLCLDLGPRYGPERTGLECFEVYHPAQKAALGRVCRVRDRLAGLIPAGAPVVFYGPVGTGKDHLLAALLYEAALLGHACRWVNGQELYGQFRDGMDAGHREEQVLRPWLEPLVLGLSDPVPPVGDPTPWNTQVLYRLIDRRYRLLRCTWVTVNALSPADADAKLSSPVFDRLQDGAELIPCFWPSFRERSRN